MPQARMIVFSSPSDLAREDEFNRWYDEVHVADLCAIPGVTSAARFKLSDVQLAPGLSASGHSYMAVYELDAPDLRSVLDEIKARSTDGRLRSSDVIDTANPPAVLLFESC